MNWIDAARKTVSGENHVLIAGPTAIGKSALALAIARDIGGPVINADALQVYQDWRVLTARPTEAEEAGHRHELYGHIAGDDPYSVGRWLNDVAPFLTQSVPAVIVGGTGLYFSALTEGLAEIPPTPPEVRQTAIARLKFDGPEAMLNVLDPETRSRIDVQNPARIQRAWEVLRTTGRGLAEWQDETGPPLLPLDHTTPLVINAPKSWLNPRIATRFNAMLEAGVLDEVRANVPGWHPGLASAKAIGAADIVAHVRGETTLEVAREAVLTLTRQYAKRQRSWLRSRMRGWVWIDPTIT